MKLSEVESTTGEKYPTRSFLLWAEKRKYYGMCLVDVINFLEGHSESIKFARMNNAKGILKILKALLSDLEQFTELGEEIKLTVTKDKEVRVVE